ncbi:alpha-2,8-sialyltransferase 8B-like [Diadema setosum]|uniref:alpha-2,8-sialyltransferase 8B-like n=1 Tax=Diadema setosum TaxID=31175 RepID=UPI003B3BD37D
MRMRKKVESVVKLRDAIQIFNSKTNRKQFVFINASDDKSPRPSKLVSDTFTERPRRCAIVGNSGILLGSQCGKDIDTHDFVLRMNLAPFGRDYADDVGSRTTMTTMNRVQLMQSVRCAENQTRYAAVPASPLCVDLLRRLRDVGNGIVWYTKGGFRDRLDVAATWVHRNGQGSGREDIRWAYSPRVMEGICAKLWKNRNPSTGLIAFSLASLFCDEISLYGFYPFERDSSNRTISYHYYEPESSMNFVYNKHRMPIEFRIFKLFARMGGSLVTDPCR